MDENIQVQSTFTEDKFEALIWEKGLSVEERESLRKYLHLSCNEAITLCLTNWRGYARIAIQKIGGMALLGH